MSLPTLTFNAPVVLDLDVSGEKEAIGRTAELLRGCPDVTDEAGLLEAVFERQRINPPVLGSGIALPHARTGCVREIVCVAARLAAPVPFGPERIPVRLIFLFGIPPSRISGYLALTAGLVKRLRDPAVTAGLLSAETADEFQQLLER